jgi:hypothetical protein
VWLSYTLLVYFTSRASKKNFLALLPLLGVLVRIGSNSRTAQLLHSIESENYFRYTLSLMSNKEKFYQMCSRQIHYLPGNDNTSEFSLLRVALIFVQLLALRARPYTIFLSNFCKCFVRKSNLIRYITKEKRMLGVNSWKRNLVKKNKYIDWLIDNRTMWTIYISYR